MPASASRLQRVVRSCDEAAAHARELRLAVLEELGRSVPFDAYSWLLTDPATGVGCAPLADVPCLPELPRLIRLKYLTPVNRWTHLDGPVARLRAATGGEPDRSLVWRELLRRYDVTDVASAVFRDEFGCWAFLDLWRTGGEFTADEQATLAAAAPSLTAALRRAQARTFPADAGHAPRTGPVVLVLTADLDVRAQTPETDAYLRVLVPPDGDRRPIPAAALNVAAQLAANEAGVDGHPATARVHLADGVWLTLRAARIGDTAAPERRDIAVTIESSTPTERLDVFTRAHGFTSREAELLAHLVAGDDTRRVAEAMFLSEHTVQDHLKSIFAKTGARSRRAVLARTTGR